jgi:hypothetical protein
MRHKEAVKLLSSLKYKITADEILKIIEETKDKLVWHVPFYF